LLFSDRNFVAGTFFVATVGLTYYVSLALQPPFLQDLMNYPVVTAGLVSWASGVGTMGAMMVVGKLIGRVDTRFLLGIGLALTAWAFHVMTGWTADVSQLTIAVVSVIQGVGLGFLFVPLSTVTLSTLSPEQRAVWSIAAGLTQPIFDGGMRRAARRTVLASFKASAADYQQTVLQAFGQVADVLQGAHS